MTAGKHVNRNIRILVKAFPQASDKYEETVCCAGITDDGKKLLRLFPIRYRRLPMEDRFDRFDLVEMTITKASENRPESYRVDEGSIRLIERGGKISDESKVRLWRPFISPSIQALQNDNKETGRSLGIIKPDPQSLKFYYKEASQSDVNDQEVADQVYKQQTSFLEDPLKLLEKPKYGFYYNFVCDGRPGNCSCSRQPHNHQLHDWEVQATFFYYKRRYKTEEKALEMIQQEYGQNIPQRNLHFVMGTMKKRQKMFIVIGLLRTGIEIDMFDAQKDLF